jgi:cellulose biosynthesis protein BcsQ
VRLAEAPSYGQAIVEYDPSSRGAEAYESFVNELTTRLHLSPQRHLGKESAEGCTQ